MNIRTIYLLAAGLTVFTAATTVFAEEIRLRNGLEGYQGTIDTGVDSSQANYNYGGDNTLFLGNTGGTEQKMLLRFDLSGYTGTVTGDATLTLYQAPISGSTDDFTVNVYAISSANGGWTEGTGTGASAGTGAPAVNGEPTWDYFSYNTDADEATSWAGSAGLSTSGVDYASTPVATYLYDVSEGFVTVSITISASVVQGWIDDPSSNNGLLFMAESGQGRYRSSENSSGFARPTLTFDLVAIPEASTISLALAAALFAGCTAVIRKRRQRG